ncbi:hypothetical protein RW110999_081 [Cyanophage S-RIM4]|nr:hypothetical protein RW110999_081 [Cyanophage S-RIM4]
MRLTDLKKATELLQQVGALIEDNDAAPYLTSYLSAVSVELNRQIAQFESYEQRQKDQESEEQYKKGLYGKTDPVSGKLTMPTEEEMGKSMEEIMYDRATDQQQKVLSDGLPIPDYKLDFPDGQCLDC